MSFYKDEGGATAIEYILIGVCVGLAIVIAAQAIGLSLQDFLNKLVGAF